MIAGLHYIARHKYIYNDFVAVIVYQSYIVLLIVVMLAVA